MKYHLTPLLFLIIVCVSCDPDSDKMIEHHMESANFQRMWGTVAKRKYVLEGDTLTLYPLRNSYPKTRLKWVKEEAEQYNADFNFLS